MKRLTLIFGICFLLLFSGAFDLSAKTKLRGFEKIKYPPLTSFTPPNRKSRNRQWYEITVD